MIVANNLTWYSRLFNKPLNHLCFITPIFQMQYLLELVNPQNAIYLHVSRNL